jgi:hypothetical protein
VHDLQDVTTRGVRQRAEHGVEVVEVTQALRAVDTAVALVAVGGQGQSTS